jgi:hypothetical protein
VDEETRAIVPLESIAQSEEEASAGLVVRSPEQLADHQTDSVLFTRWLSLSRS